MNYTQVEEYILEIPKFTTKNKAEHTRYLLEQLGNPQENMKIIHVAGTNGKGSVCAYIANTLIKNGKKTGLFTSPHLVEMTERIRIDNENVAKETFVDVFERVKRSVEEMMNKGMPHPSFFEFLFVMAMVIFKKCGTEYIVLETGLGGRLDATNVIDKPILTVITSIGMDHTEILGDSIEKIAAEKAGIVKYNVPVIYLDENREAAKVIENRAKEMKAEAVCISHKDYKIVKKTNNDIDFCSLCGYYLNDTFSVPFISEYQVENAMLAITAVSMLSDIRENVSALKEGISTVVWQGRMEQVQKGIYFDGAHNGPGVDEFVKTVCEYSCKGKKRILFTAVKEKDYQYMASMIDNVIKPDKVYVTQINGERCLKAGTIANAFQNVEVMAFEDIAKAFNRAIEDKTDEDVLFCVGSLYLIGELKKLIEKV